MSFLSLSNNMESGLFPHEFDFIRDDSTRFGEISDDFTLFISLFICINLFTDFL